MENSSHCLNCIEPVRLYFFFDQGWMGLVFTLFTAVNISFARFSFESQCLHGFTLHLEAKQEEIDRNYTFLNNNIIKKGLTNSSIQDTTFLSQPYCLKQKIVAKCRLTVNGWNNLDSLWPINLNQYAVNHRFNLKWSFKSVCC